MMRSYQHSNDMLVIVLALAVAGLVILTIVHRTAAK
jgi:hypothetical protein